MSTITFCFKDAVVLTRSSEELDSDIVPGQYMSIDGTTYEVSATSYNTETGDIKIGLRAAA
jgi:hypothetical protein